MAAALAGQAPRNSSEASSAAGSSALATRSKPSRGKNPSAVVVSRYSSASPSARASFHGGPAQLPAQPGPAPVGAHRHGAQQPHPPVRLHPRDPRERAPRRVPRDHEAPREPLGGPRLREPGAGQERQDVGKVAGPRGNGHGRGLRGADAVWRAHDVRTIGMSHGEALTRLA